MTRRGPCLGLTLALLWPVGSLDAQSPIRLVPPSGEVGTSFLRSRFEFGGVGQGERTWTEWVRLRLGAALFDPRLLSVEAELKPTRVQSAFTPASDSGDGGRRFQGSAAVHVLRARTVSGTLRGLRSSVLHNGRLGSTADIRQEEWSATIRDRDPIFPTEIRYDDRIRDAVWAARSGLAPIHTDERTRTFGLSARNSKTGLQAERVDYRERTRDRGYVRWYGGFDHDLRWGKGSRLATQVQYVERAELSPFSQVSWQESVRLQHYTEFWSDWDYRMGRQHAPAGDYEDRYGRLRTTWRPSEKLELELAGLTRSRRSDLASQWFAQAGPTLRLVLPLPASVRLVTSVSTGYEWHEQAARQDAFVDVLQESHTVDASGRFRLDKPFAAADGVVLASADGRELFEEGFDYRVVSSGMFVEVIILPSGRISEGDVVTADYRVSAAPTAAGNAWTQTYDFRLQRGGVQLYHRRYRQESLDPLPPGTLPLLRGWDQSTTGLGAAWSGRAFTLSAAAERRADRTDMYDFSSDAVHASLGFRHDALTTSVTSSWSRLHGGPTPYELLQSELRAGWLLSQRLRIDGFASQWQWETDADREEFLGGGGSLEWQWGRTVLEARVDRIRWMAGDARTETRAFLSVARKFEL